MAVKKNLTGAYDDVGLAPELVDVAGELARRARGCEIYSNEQCDSQDDSEYC